MQPRRQHRKKTKQPLHYFLEHKEWDGAYDKLLNTPNANRCGYTRGGKLLLLELVNSEAPPKLVDLVARSSPEDIIRKRALHLAIISQSRKRKVSPTGNPQPDSRTEIVKVLLQILRDHLGGDKDKLQESLLVNYFDARARHASTALHLACQDSTCDLEMLKHLVEACPKALLQRNNSPIPLQLFHRCASVQGTRHAFNDAMVWEKLEYLAVATYLASSAHSVEFASEKKEFVLHALVGDSSLTAITSQILSTVIGRCERRCAFAKDAAGRVPLHRIVRTVRPELWGVNNVEGLLRLAPETAEMSTPHGNYPLHLALSTAHASTLSWEKGLGSILEAYPEALAIRGKMGLYPFQIAAAKNAPVDIVYRLLRAQPELVLPQGVFQC